MKVYWNYRCDEGHTWTLFREKFAEESPEDCICPEGHEAVTLQKETPIDEVVISILPAGVIYDEVSPKKSGNGKYWFVLTNRVGGDEERRTKQSYNWLEISELITKFRSLNREKAWKLWDKMEL